MIEENRFVPSEEQIKRTLQCGEKLSYDETENVKPSQDFAEYATRGILYDLNDRRGIKIALAEVDDEIRSEIVETISEIIRQAYAEFNNAKLA